MPSFYSRNITIEIDLVDEVIPLERSYQEIAHITNYHPDLEIENLGDLGSGWPAHSITLPRKFLDGIAEWYGCTVEDLLL